MVRTSWQTGAMDTTTGPSTDDLSLDQLVELERRAAQGTGGNGPTGGDDGGGGGRRGGGEPIVLPWWQHPMNIVTMVVTAALLAGMIGWMIGDDRTEPHNAVDTGFLQDMRVHHEQAVLMSFVYRSRDDIDPGLSTIARSILRGQNIEIGRMIQMLRQFGETEANETGTSMTWMSMVAEEDQMPGMASEAELDLLASSDGREADELFTELMIEHHEGGIEMAEFAIENAEHPEVIAFATSMASAQRGEIAEMLGVLND
jgi:uncharacterized protein (DUF305 family)